jgi:hypothetical protein
MLQALHMGLLHRLQHQGHLCMARHAANAENRWTNRSLQDGHDEEQHLSSPPSSFAQYISHNKKENTRRAKGLGQKLP